MPRLCAMNAAKHKPTVAHQVGVAFQASRPASAAEINGQQYDFVFVDQNSFEKHAPKNFAALTVSFKDYKA